MYRSNFTLQPNLVMNSGVYSSLNSNCHYRIIYAKFNLKILYPPLLERVVWHYQDVNNDLIQRSISQFNWKRAFSYKVIIQDISIFNETIFNIMKNFIPHKTKTFNDRKPPWVNNQVKTMTQDLPGLFEK